MSGTIRMVKNAFITGRLYCSTDPEPWTLRLQMHMRKING